MDAILRTQSDSCGLTMKGIKQFSDGSGGTCTLDVLSGSFSAKIDFFFDWPPLSEFISSLEKIERTLSGEAQLGQQFEDSYIAFHGDGLGHVKVSGLLAVHSENTQKLEFSFQTDQTALAPLIGDLRACSDTQAA